MMRRFFYTVMFAVLACSGAQTWAQDCWQIAPGRSKVEFHVKHLIFFDVVGRFKNIEGCIDTFSPDFADARAEVKVDASSIYTGNADRDKHLKSDDFFDIEKFPYLSFTGRSFVRDEGELYRVSGDLTVRDVTNALSVRGEYKGIQEMANGKTRAEFDLTGSLNRFDYGLRWNGLDEEGRMLVGDTVEFQVHLVLIKTQATLAHIHRGEEGWDQQKLGM